MNAGVGGNCRLGSFGEDEGDTFGEGFGDTRRGGTGGGSSLRTRFGESNGEPLLVSGSSVSSASAVELVLLLLMQLLVEVVLVEVPPQEVLMLPPLPQLLLPMLLQSSRLDVSLGSNGSTTTDSVPLISHRQNGHP